MKTESLNSEEQSALQAYARVYGRTWKANLRRDWELANLTGILQQLRNDPKFGPAGLIRFRL